MKAEVATIPIFRKDDTAALQQLVCSYIHSYEVVILSRIIFAKQCIHWI